MLKGLTMYRWPHKQLWRQNKHSVWISQYTLSQQALNSTKLGPTCPNIKKKKECANKLSVISANVIEHTLVILKNGDSWTINQHKSCTIVERTPVGNYHFVWTTHVLYSLAFPQPDLRLVCNINILVWCQLLLIKCGKQMILNFIIKFTLFCFARIYINVVFLHLSYKNWTICHKHSNKEHKGYHCSCSHVRSIEENTKFLSCCQNSSQSPIYPGKSNWPYRHSYK